MKRIEAIMVKDWVQPYAREGGYIPVAVASTHPRFNVGTRLDWGFVKAALADGYTVSIAPKDPTADV